MSNRAVSLILIIASSISIYLFFVSEINGTTFKGAVPYLAFFGLLPIYASYGVWRKTTAGIVAGIVYFLPQCLGFTAKTYSYHAMGPVSLWLTFGSAAEMNEFVINVFAIFMVGLLVAIYDSREDKCS